MSDGETHGIHQQYDDAVARYLTHAIMRHYGYTDEQIEVAEQGVDHEAFGCEFDGNHMRWDCMDENGTSRHPDHDEFACTASLMVDVVVPVVEVEVERAWIAGHETGQQRGQRDLVAKVEAVLTTWRRELADYPDTEGGRAARAAVRIAAGEVQDALADALPQDADSEPASVPTNAREGGNGQRPRGRGERPADRRTAAQEGDLAALEYLMRVQRRATSDDVREIAAELEAELRAKTRDGGAGL